MTDTKRKAIEQLISETQNDPDNIAMILIGSTAKDEAKDYSDIDLYLVVSDKKNRKIEKDKNYFYGSWDPDRYCGIEVDGKIIGMDYLREALENANDATRYSFINAEVLYAKNGEINELIKKIPVYPESEHEQRLKLFFAYVKHYRYVGEEAFTRKNLFHAFQCVMQLVFFSGRLVLAYNRKLYPCHKRLLSEAEKCSEKPEDFIRKSNQLLNNFSLDAMIEYYETVAGYFSKLEYPDQERIGYILEDEWAWKTGKLPVSEI